MLSISLWNRLWPCQLFPRLQQHLTIRLFVIAVLKYLKSWKSSFQLYQAIAMYNNRRRTALPQEGAYVFSTPAQASS